MSKHYDYIIIGAGAAGLQLGYFLKKKERDFVILESSDHVGDFFKTFPRHRAMISINKVYTGYDDEEINLRWDWNSLLNEEDTPLLFKTFAKEYFPHADKMVEYLNAFRTRYDLPVKFNHRVSCVKKEGDTYHIKLDSETISCRVLIIATGFSNEYKPPIPGIELVESYSDVSINPADFCNQRVLIIGKGNSSFETADNLISTASSIHLVSPSPISFAWSTHYVGHLRAVNNNFLDTYQLKSQNAVLDATIKTITKVGSVFSVAMVYTHAENEIETIEYDRIICCTGFGFDHTPYASLSMALCYANRFPAQTAQWESINNTNIFFIGALMHMRDYKRQMSGFIHGFRYNIRTLHHLLEERYHAEPYPRKEVNLDAEEIVAFGLSRINRSSALWQQPGYLMDVILVNRRDKIATVLEDLSSDLISERYAFQEYITVSLEFGSKRFGNPFDVNRIARDNVRQAKESHFLHPVIRYFRANELISTHHIIEDLAAEWKEEEHIMPFKQYINKIIDETPTHNREKLREKCNEYY